MSTLAAINTLQVASSSELGDTLSSLGIRWNSIETLQRISQVCFACRQSALAFCQDALRAAAAPIRAAEPEVNALTLLGSVVDAVLIPDRLTANERSYDELIRIYEQFQAFENACGDASPIILDRNNPWTIRSAVQRLWHDEFAKLSTPKPLPQPVAGSHTWSILQSAGMLLAEYFRMRERMRTTIDYPVTHWRRFTAKLCGESNLRVFRPGYIFADREYELLRAQRGWTLRPALTSRPIVIEPIAPVVAESPAASEPQPESLPPTKPTRTPKRRGRRGLSEPEVRARSEMLDAFDRAKIAKVSAKEFCEDYGCTMDELRQASNWRTQRVARKAMTK